jgi:hypothetical protein
MYLPGSPLEAIEQLSTRMQQLTKGLLEGFPLEQAALPLEGIEDLYQHFDSDQLFLVTDGMIHLNHDGKNLISFDEGDLVGLYRAFDLPSPTLRADEFVEIKVIDRDSFLRHVYSDKRRQHYWSHFLMCQNSILLNRIAQLSKDQAQTIAGFQNCLAGDVIIKEGDEAEHVYTIISGEADVFADGVKVGEIGEDEVFGAMAVFTGERRSATVQARTPCTIMAVPQHQFINLIEAQPQAAVNLIENLARRITAMNQQLVDQQK